MWKHGNHELYEKSEISNGRLTIPGEWETRVGHISFRFCDMKFLLTVHVPFGQVGHHICFPLSPNHICPHIKRPM